MKSKKILSLLAVAALATTILVGCGDKAAFKDGEYKATGETDERGNTPKIVIEVKDGKIAKVDFDEFNAEGVGKSENAEYNESMLSKGMTSSPKTAFPELEAALVEKQDVATVDVVTSVTTSSETFKELATKALKDAAN